MSGKIRGTKLLSCAQGTGVSQKRLMARGLYAYLLRGGNVVVPMFLLFGMFETFASVRDWAHVSLFLAQPRKGANMKKTLIAVAVTLLLSTAAYADTVNITVVADFISPSGSSNANIAYAFRPSAPITFRVAGRTCTWVSSSSPYGSGGGAGCNYNITVDSSGNFTNATSNGMGCTASGPAMISACH
jgi:hypothetical protein